jgi:hypothetical protein
MERQLKPMQVMKVVKETEASGREKQILPVSAVVTTVCDTQRVLSHDHLHRYLREVDAVGRGVPKACPRSCYLDGNLKTEGPAE